MPPQMGPHHPAWRQALDEIYDTRPEAVEVTPARMFASFLLVSCLRQATATYKH